MQTAMAHEHVDGGATAGTLVIFTRVEGLLRQRATAPCDLSREARDALLAAHVPLVLVSDASATDVQQFQREIGLVQPFICGHGAALYIPAAYFSDTDEPAAGPWEVFSFDPADTAAAIRLLSALFVARGHDKILSVGLGCDCGDGTMLAAVDVPIVVRDQHRDQQPLLQYVPGAYLTTATGAAGWLEAVIGPSLR
jgi:predicted mannosyl-3-phosphoglycerate phosphatase (HAD superfamily)